MFSLAPSQWQRGSRDPVLGPDPGSIARRGVVPGLGAPPKLKWERLSWTCVARYAK